MGRNDARRRRDQRCAWCGRHFTAEGLHHHRNSATGQYACQTHSVILPAQRSDQPVTKPAAQLLREVAARDPEAHSKALARAYGVDRDPSRYTPRITNEWLRNNADAIGKLHGVPLSDWIAAADGEPDA